MSGDPIFAKQEALERVDGDRDLLVELFQTLFSDWESSLSALEESCRRQSPTEIAHQAHALKSALGNLGGMQAYRTAQSIEMLAKKSDLSAVTSKLEDLKTQGDAFRKEASRELGAEF